MVSLFDPDWGQRFFERVLLLVRDIANPSVDDRFFPQFRQKDWYFGNSWASGISSATYPNGKNQESSSEAIAAYEAVSLYGSVMVSGLLSCPITSRRSETAYLLSLHCKSTRQILMFFLRRGFLSFFTEFCLEQQ